jgi:predicted Rossmann-fold nucleotide-binding protein
MRRKVIGVMGSHGEAWEKFTYPLGEWIAREGWHLLTGSGGGVMTAVSEAFTRVEARQGICIGIAPSKAHPDLGYAAKPGYPNASVELAILSPLGNFNWNKPEALTRNHINILTSDAIVALPGGSGTQNEIELAVRFRKPVILFGPEHEFISAPAGAPRTVSLSEVQEFIRQSLGR